MAGCKLHHNQQVLGLTGYRISHARLPSGIASLHTDMLRRCFHFFQQGNPQPTVGHMSIARADTPCRIELAGKSPQRSFVVVKFDCFCTLTRTIPCGHCRLIPIDCLRSLLPCYGAPSIGLLKARSEVMSSPTSNCSDCYWHMRDRPRQFDGCFKGR